MTTAASIRINKELDAALSSAAKDFNTTRAAIVKMALAEYLQDLSDSKAIAEAKKQGGVMVAFDEVRKDFGL